MSSLVPHGWSTIKIASIGNFYGGLTGKTAKDFGHGEFFLSYMQVLSEKTNNKEKANLVKINQGEKHNKVKFGDILFTSSSETPDEIGMTTVFLEKDWTPYLNSFCFGLRPIVPSPVDPYFAKYLFRGTKFRKDIIPLAQGSTRFNLSKENLKKLNLILPTIPEQKKIASILTSVDEVIKKTQKKINKLQDLKKSVMIDLMNKGINHKEFKDTKLGKIPKTWNIYKYNDLLKIVDNKMEMKDDKFYSLLSIRRRNGGVFSREKLIGKKILTKTLGKAIVNTFIISKMQIVHGASGYISEKFKDHYVSSSYTQFAAKDRNKINTKFLFYYSHLDKVYKQFLLSSHGVHIEKMTFDLKDWYKKEIILPNIEEQQEIVRIIESFENHISNTEKKLEKYNFFKKSLLQDLLTGKVRVSVN